MTTWPSRLIFALLPAALLVAPPASAQQPAPLRAQVDLLIFRHVSASLEQAGNIVRTSPHDSDPVYTGTNLFSTETAVAGNRSVRLSEKSNLLEEEAKKISDSEDFELLQRISWDQPAPDPQNAFHVSLLPTRRDGLLKAAAKLSLERYFQLEISLLYEPGFIDSEPVEQDSPETETVLIRLDEVMTDNILYYLDHPLLGVLAVITVLKPDNFEASE